MNDMFQNVEPHVRTVLVAALFIAVVFGAYGLYTVLGGGSDNSSSFYRIAIVTRTGVSTYEEAIIGYRAKMRELGYIEGKNISYDIQYYTNASDLAPIMEKVVASRPDIISTYSTPATVEAYKQTKDAPLPIPVLFVSVADPLAAGVIRDIQKPGTNVTGIASLQTELVADRLRLLKEVVPSIRRVAMPRSDESLGDAAANKSVVIARQVAPSLDMTITPYPLLSADGHAAVAARITNANTDAIVFGGDSLVWSGIDIYAKQAIQEKLPLAVTDVSQVKKGALLGISPDYTVLGEQAAEMCNKILRGGEPASIPVQVPRRLVVAVNTETARAIGVTFSEAFLQKVDEVVGQ